MPSFVRRALTGVAAAAALASAVAYAPAGITGGTAPSSTSGTAVTDSGAVSNDGAPIDTRPVSYTACPTPRSGLVRTAPGYGKTVALTFDDGASPYVPAYLKILRAKNVRATFFDTGAHDARYPAYVKAIVREGHLLANHTYDHAYPSQVRGGWTARYMNSQMDRTTAVQVKLTDRQPCFFRPPGGYNTAGMRYAAKINRMTVVMWSVDSNDWRQPAYRSAYWTTYIYRHATAAGRQKHPVVLMHVGKASHEPESKVHSYRGNDLAALPKIIDWYRAHGYRFVDMNGRSGLPRR